MTRSRERRPIPIRRSLSSCAATVITILLLTSFAEPVRSADVVVSVPLPKKWQEQQQQESRSLQRKCDQMVKNGYGTENPDKPTQSWVALRSKLQGGLPGTQPFIKAFRSFDRTGIHSGPAQYLDAKDPCLDKPGQQLVFSARMKLKNKAGRYYACSTSQWNKPNTCPLFSFRLFFPDGAPSKWFNSWNQGLRGRGWSATGWNLYSTVFTVDADLARASQLYFMIRGPPGGVEIILSNVSLLPYAPPTNAPTNPPPTPAPTRPQPTPSPTSKPTYYRYVAPNTSKTGADAATCDLEVFNGDFEKSTDRNPWPWTVNGGGVLSVVTPGDGGSNYALKHTGRTENFYGPRYTLTAACLRENANVIVRARIKVEKPGSGERRRLEDAGGNETATETETETDGSGNATDTDADAESPTESESDTGGGGNETATATESETDASGNETETETANESDSSGNETVTANESDSSGNETVTANESESESDTSSNETVSTTGSESDAGGNETVNTPESDASGNETVTTTSNNETATTTSNNETVTTTSNNETATTTSNNETETTTSNNETATTTSNNETATTTSNNETATTTSNNETETTTSSESDNETETDSSGSDGSDSEVETQSDGSDADADDPPAPLGDYACDPLGASNASCPILTLHVVYEYGEEHSYHPNINLGAWDADDYNDFQTVFKVTDRFADAQKVHMYFERVPVGYDIVLDNVEVEEFQPIPEDNIVLEGNDEHDLSDCDVIVVNGDAELGDTSGWTARFGGHLTIRNEGADNTNYSFEHGARSSFIMGPRHVLKTECFTPNMLYDFEAKIKLLDEDGTPFACDKSHTWIDELSCPILTFQIEAPSGAKNWYYFGNSETRPWEADFWNLFKTKFAITPDMVGAKSAYFYIERPRSGVILVVDQVVISRDCTQLFVSGDAEDESTLGWRVMNGAGGYVGVHPLGAGDSKFSYGHFGRTDKGGGPGHEIDPGCLVNGTQYEFTVMLRLIDENDNNKFVSCRKYLAWGDPDFCPLMSITFKDENNKAFTKNYDNMIPLTFVADDWNLYKARFTMTEEMQSSKVAFLVLKGVRPGVAILYDDVKLEVYEDLPPPGCSSLVVNGDFEDGDVTGWDRYHSGTFQILDDGAEGSSKSLLTVERTLPGAGPEFNLDTRCLVEGREYELKAKMKLQDINGNPFACVRGAPFGDALTCPYVSIHMIDSDKKQTVKHYMDESPSEWIDTEWNDYSFRFTVSHELGTAAEAMIVFKGFSVDVGLVLDRVRLTQYEAPTANCGQLVTNTNAEIGSLTGWTVHGGGILDIVEDGATGSAHAFKSHSRTLVSHGPMQYLPVECLKEGRVYDFYMHIKLLDENDQPYSCDKAANWNTEFTCPLVTLNVHKEGVMTRTHAVNEYGAAWIKDDFNQYHAEITITTEMAEADKVAFFVQGPRSGVKMVYDNVSMRAKNGSIN